MVSKVEVLRQLALPEMRRWVETTEIMVHHSGVIGIYKVYWCSDKSIFSYLYATTDKHFWPPGLPYSSARRFCDPLAHQRETVTTFLNRKFKQALGYVPDQLRGRKNWMKL